MACLKAALVEDNEISKTILTLIDIGLTTLVGEALIIKKEQQSKNKIPHEQSTKTRLIETKHNA